MSDAITVTGLVATTPKHIITGEGLAVTTFRLASAQRRYDRTQQKWVDGETNWYTIATFRQLATNVVGSLQKGQRIVVTGRLRVRDWSTDDKKGTNVEIDAEALGHDLSWGTAAFTRSASAAVSDDERAVAAEGADGESASTESAGTDTVGTDTLGTDTLGTDTLGTEGPDDDRFGAAPAQEAVGASTPF